MTTTMTGAEYKRILNQLGLTHGANATIAFLDISMTTTYGWAHGKRPIPKAVAMLLRLMAKNHLTPNDVENDAGPPAAPAGPAAPETCESTPDTARATYGPPSAPT